MKVQICGVWKRLATAGALACLTVATPRVGVAQNTMRAPVRDPQRFIAARVWSYQELQRMNVVMQGTDYSCGAAAMATIAKYYWGDNVDEKYFLDRLAKLEFTKAELEDRIKNGLTLTDLRNLAHKSGYEAEMGKLSFNDLAKAKVPLIVGLKVDDYDHFAVYRGTDLVYVYLADSSRGNVRTEVPEFVRQWQANAVLAVAKPNTPIKTINPLAITGNEVYRGALNRQTIRRNALAPSIPFPVPSGP